MFSSLYQTSDFGLATAILTGGFEIKEVNRENPRRVYFLFESSNELKDLVDGYWNGSLTQQTSRILDSIKHLKSVMYG